MAQIIGLTGGIATGKSTVSQMFKDAKIPVIDTDQIARDLLNKGTDVYEEVLQHFSQEILLTSGDINRNLLGQLIFGNQPKRELLNRIVHPHVSRMVDAEIKQLEELGHDHIVIDVPLLFESGFDKKCDKTVVVYATDEEQLQRLMSRDHISEDYAKVKMEAQMPLQEKVQKADYTIDNSFSILETKKSFLEVLKGLEVT